jgi:hypothetical protein
VTELLLHQSEVNVGGYQMAGNRVFEDVRVLLVCWHASLTSYRPKQPEKLCAIKPSAFLAGEEVKR